MTADAHQPPVRLATLTRLVRECTSGSTRRLLLVVALLAVGMRLAVLGAAFAVTQRDYFLASVLGAFSVVVGVSQRIASSHVRVFADGDAHRRVADSLLEADLFALSPFAIREVLDRGIWDLQELVVTAPIVVADAFVTAAMLPFLTVVLPSRVVVLIAGGILVTFAAVIPFRRMSQSLHAHALAARIALADTFSLVVEGRLELVATASEDRFRAELNREIGVYSRSMRRASFGTALMGRAPLALAAGITALAISIDVRLRDSMQDAFERWGLLVAASLPPLLGLLIGGYGVIRATATLAPLSALLGGRVRDEIGRSGELLEAPMVARLEDVSFRYSPSAENDVVSNVSLEWRSGQVLLLGGPNGSGKSTVLRLLLGLREPTSGVVRFNGIDLRALDVRAIRAMTAYLPQRPYLGGEHLVIRDALRLLRADPSDAECLHAIERVRLDLGADPLSRRVGELSSGQRQRLALARILLQEASIIILDEPDANLDRDGIALTAGLIRDLAGEGALVAVAAHSTELAAVADQTFDLGEATSSAEP